MFSGDALDKAFWFIYLLGKFPQPFIVLPFSFSLYLGDTFTWYNVQAYTVKVSQDSCTQTSTSAFYRLPRSWVSCKSFQIQFMHIYIFLLNLHRW